MGIFGVGFRQARIFPSVVCVARLGSNGCVSLLGGEPFFSAQFFFQESRLLFKAVKACNRTVWADWAVSSYHSSCQDDSILEATAVKTALSSNFHQSFTLQ